MVSVHLQEEYEASEPLNPPCIMHPAIDGSNATGTTAMQPRDRSCFRRWLAAGVLLGALFSIAVGADDIEPSGAGPETFVQQRKWDPVIRGYVGFRLTIRAAETETFRRPGKHQAAVGDRTLVVRIRRASREDLLQSDGGQGLSEVTFAGWESWRRTVFRTGRGVLCHVPQEERRGHWLLRSLSRGQKLLMKETERSDGSMRVERLLYAPSEVWPRRKLAWKVQIRVGEGEEVWFWKPGRYRLGDIAEGVSVHLQEVRKCRLSVENHTLDAYVADTPRARYRGLQQWEELEADEAMLFVFQRPLRPSFVMKEVSFPLSIAFARHDGTLVHIGRRSPGDQRPVRPPRSVTCVLEVNRGWFSERGLGTADSLDFEAMAAPQ